jgi:hypothetical protein
MRVICIDHTGFSGDNHPIEGRIYNVIKKVNHHALFQPFYVLEGFLKACGWSQCYFLELTGDETESLALSYPMSDAFRYMQMAGRTKPKDMKQYTHFIEVWRLSTGKAQAERVKEIDELTFALQATKDIGCETLFVWKIKMKENYANAK